MRKPLFQKKIFPQITSDLMTNYSPFNALVLKKWTYACLFSGGEAWLAVKNATTTENEAFKMQENYSPWN